MLLSRCWKKKSVFQNFDFLGTFGIRDCIEFLCQKYLKKSKLKKNALFSEFKNKSFLFCRRRLVEKSRLRLSTGWRPAALFITPVLKDWKTGSQTKNSNMFVPWFIVVQIFHMIFDQFIAVKIMAHYASPFVLYYVNQCNTKSVTYNKYI